MGNYKYKSDEILKWIFYVLGGGIALFGILSGYGIKIFSGQNLIVDAARQTGAVSHGIGTLLYIGAAFVIVKWVNDDWEVNAKLVVAVLALFGLGIMFNMGFHF